MWAQYRCGSDTRRQAVAASPAQVNGLALNGIDFVEVIDREAPSADLRQRLLRLFFLKPDGIAALRPANLLIEGGTRITAIVVQSVAPLAGSDRALELTLDRYGDFGLYVLRVVDDAGLGPPAHIDPPLSQVTFSFKSDCPTGFDCAVDMACPPDTPASPPLDTLAKDYESFRALMLDRMAATAPDWTERNPADLGVTLVEMLADAADRLSYYQDAVATEAYLGTARKRVSVRRHARLTGFRLHEGTNARSFVVFEVSADVAATDPAGTPVPVLPRGTRLLTTLPRDTILSAADADDVLAAAEAVFETLEDVVALQAARDAIAFHTWGDSECCLARGATSAFLARPDAALSLASGDLLILEEGPRANGGPADPHRRHVVRLSADPTLLRDHVAALDVLEIVWPKADAVPFSLRLDGAVVRGNVVTADHGRTIVAGDTALDPPAPDPARPWRPALAEDLGVVQAAAFDPAAMRVRPAMEALTQDVDAVLPSVSLTAAGETWLPTTDLLGEDRFAPTFVLETETDERSRFRFGDGLFGRRPPDEFAAVRWRRGGGTAGNIGADALAHLLLPATELRDAMRAGFRSGRFAFADLAAADVAAATIIANLQARVTAVRNPLPAIGGTAPDPTLTAKLQAPQAFKVNERAVTPADYAAAAQRHPDVQRAVAARRWMGSWHVVFLTVDRKGRRPVDTAFESELVRFLERFRLAGHDLEVEPPRFVPLDIALWVCIEPGFVAADVEAALQDRFTSGTRKDGMQGFFHPDRFSFGDPVPLSRVIAEAMAIPGVRWVGVRRPGGLATNSAAGVDGYFRKLREPATDYADAGLIPIAPLEVALLDNDPSRPENGRLRLLVEGGL
jgi:hypothetical protein